jgi:hypothetical protein
MDVIEKRAISKDAAPKWKGSRYLFHPTRWPSGYIKDFNSCFVSRKESILGALRYLSVVGDDGSIKICSY